MLATLGQDPGWVQRLGDAFLAQPDDVMDAVQVLRHKAQDAGNLANNEYQKISTQPAPARASAPPPEEAVQYDDSGAGAYTAAPQQTYSDTIVIEPSDPQVVYVPSYNPTTAYGTWSYPSYPPPYYPPPSAYYPVGTALARGLAWGTGVAIADSLWGDCDWNGGDIDINVNSYNSLNTNRQISSNSNRWEHNSINRDGVPYRDQRSRDQFSNRLADSGSRDHLRGDDANRARQREQARQSMQGRGMDAPARTNREAQQRAERAQRDIAQRDAGQRDRAAAGGRDAQRDRAQAATADRQRQAQQRDRAQAQQRDRSQAQQRDRAQAQQRDRQASGQRQQAGQHRQQTQHRQQGANNNASRNQARQQAQRQQRPHNDAFNGARQPQQSRSQAQRGHASQNRSRQQQGGRQQQSQQVNRQARSGGGAQHAQRSGGARTGGGHRR